MAEFDEARAETNKRQAALLASMAESGTAGRRAFENAQKGMASSKDALTQAALARAQAANAPAALGAQHAAQIATPFDRQGAAMAATRADFGAYNANRASAGADYMRNVNAAIPIAQAAAERALQTRLAKASREGEMSDSERMLYGQGYADLASAANAEENDAALKPFHEKDRTKASQHKAAKLAVAELEAALRKEKSGGNREQNTVALLRKEGVKGALKEVERETATGIRAASGLGRGLYNAAAWAGNNTLGNITGKRVARAEAPPPLVLGRAPVIKSLESQLANAKAAEAAALSARRASRKEIAEAAKTRKTTDKTALLQDYLVKQGVNPLKVQGLTGAKYAREQKAIERSLLPENVDSINTNTDVPVPKITKFLDSPKFVDAQDTIAQWHRDGVSRQQIEEDLKNLEKPFDDDEIKIAMYAARGLKLRNETKKERDKRTKGRNR